MENFEKFVSVLLIMLLMIVVNGFALMYCWDWFISNTFEAQKLTLSQSIGICFALGGLGNIKIDKEQKEVAQIVTEGLTKVVVRIVFLFTAFLAYLVLF